MKRRAMPLMLMLVVLLPGCGVQRHQVDSALIRVESDYGQIREQLALVAPDQARSIEAAIAAAVETLDTGEYEDALRMMEELQTRLRETSDRLPAMQAELESAWKTLDATVPGTLATLKQDFRGANRPPGGQRRASFDAGRRTLLELAEQWEEAQLAMKDGKLAEAVTTAEEVKTRAVGLAADRREGS